MSDRLTDPEALHLRKARELYRKWYRTRKKNPRRLARWPALTMRVDGFLMRLQPRDNATEHHIFIDAALQERSSINVLVRMVEGRRALVLDIGANCGLFSLPLGRAAGPGSRVIAFEPNPLMANRLAKNLRLNGLDRAVDVERVALGAADGEITLNLHDRNLGQSSKRHLSESGKSIVVPQRPLAVYVDTPRGYEVFVIKIDVEGVEDEVLAPFLRAVDDETLPDAILIEIVLQNSWSTDLHELLRGRGYNAVFEGDENVLFRRTG